MADNHNFRIKNGLEVGGVLIVNSSGQLQAASISGAITASTVGVTNIVTNKVVKFNGTILDDSNITDTGSLITLGSNTTVSGTISSGHITIPSGTTAKQSTDMLYIGGNGLDGADAAIYIGNGGSGGGYGYRIYYDGTGSGNLNKLIFKSENVGTNVDMLTFTADGNATFSGNISSGGITSTGNSQFDGEVQIGDTVVQNAYGLLQVNQEANNDESGIAILDSTNGRSMRLWADSTKSYINSGNGGAGDLVFNQAITVSSGGNLTGVGTISSGAITASSTVAAPGMFINTPDNGSAPGMTALFRIYGYEGRGAGIKIRDSANSASGATNREWFIGSGYAQSGFNIGYSATGSQSSYTAQNKFALDTSGNATFAGQTRTDDWFQVNSSSSLLKVNITAWSTHAVQDVLRNSYNSTIGDYLTVKASGNGADNHGAIVISDNVFAYGRTDKAAATAASTTAPFTTNAFQVSNTGNATFAGTITATTVNTGQGATEVHLMNQNVRTSDSPTFQDLTIQGNLSITGDINSYNVTDLDVTDKTITVGSGQTEANSGGSGLIIDGSGASLLWDEADNYWAMNKKLAFDSTPTTANQGLGIIWTGFDKEGTTDLSDSASIYHTTNTGGHGGSVLLISSMNDSGDGIAFSTHASSYLKHNSNNIFTDGYHPNADKWTSARNHVVTLTGAVTGTATQSVDGTTDETWTIATTATSDPTLTLTGDVTGSATFTNLGNASLSVAIVDDSHNHHRLDSTDNRDMKPNTSGIATNVQALKPFFSSYGGMTGSANTTYIDVLAFDTYSDSSGGGPSAITFKKGNSAGNPEMHIWKAGWNATTWSTGQRVFADNYHPNADKWTSARTLTLSGDVTGSVSFDGSAAINMTNTVVANNSHTHNNLSNYVLKAGDTMTGALVGTTATFIANAAAGTNALNILGSTNGSGTGITFSDNGTPAASASGQNGYLTYYHGDGQSYGSGNVFILSSSEATTTILADGKLMFKEGIYLKPSTGTGAGTRKDANWDTAYGWGNHSTAGYGDITGVTAGTGMTGGATSGNATLNVIGGTGITANADNITVDSTVLTTSTYGTTLNPVYAPVKKGSATLTNSYQTVCTVNGNSLASTVRMSISGTGPSTVVGTILDIVCNHSLDILVTSQTSTYTILTVKIVSNNNEDFAVQLKTNSTNNLPVNMEVFALNSETVAFTSTNPYTGATLEHECKSGGFASSSSGGATHGFYSNGSVLATAASVAAVAALDPVITLTGAVTGAGTMTNLGSVSISTTVPNDSINSQHYVAGSIDNEHIADNAINSEHYAAGSIDNEHIADNAINSEHYAAGSIDNEHIADNAINSEHYADNSIDALHLNVSGNGTTSQYLRSDGDGTMSWVTPPDTNTTTETDTLATVTGRGASTSTQSTFNSGIITSTNGVRIKRESTNGSIWFSGVSAADKNHALWNAYYSTDPATRGSAGSGFDGIYWNAYRGIHIRGGTNGAYNVIVAENSSGATNNHTVKLYASNVLRLSTTTTGVTIGGILTATGGTLTGNLAGTTASFSGKVDFQGDAAIEGGSGYGVFKGYTGNNNHFIVVRGAVANSSTLSITGAHQTTFVEHAENNDTSGWFFKSNQTGSYAEIARITRTGGMHLQGNKVWHAGNDGSGSTLDADLLDGRHANEFVEHMDGSRTNATNLNSYVNSGFYNTGAGTNTNMPSGAADYAQLIVAKGIDTGLQIYGGYANSTLYVRGWHSSGSTFYDWKTLWNSANDGSGSGLDADLLDGAQASDTTGINTIVKRNANGDILARKLYSTDGTNTISTFVSSTYNQISSIGSQSGGSRDLRFNLGQSGTIMTIISNKVQMHKPLLLDGIANVSTASSNIISTQASDVSGATRYHLSFTKANGTTSLGRITTNNFATTYTTSSDYRLKEDLLEVTDATAKLLSIQTRNFRWIGTDSRTDGFLAHELALIVPDAVVGEKDAMTTPTLYSEEEELPEGVSVGDVKVASVPEYQSVDQSKLVPLLIKTIQELEARITALENA